MFVRRYGQAGPLVFVLHGGPAAYGDAAPLAEGLSISCRTLEPWQRRSGDEPLTVARHVADLHQLVVDTDGGARIAIVGHSWGAMLALCYAAAHPDQTGPIVVVGCGTFDQASSKRRREIIEERMDAELRDKLNRIETESVDPVQRFMRKVRLTRHLSDFDTIDPYAECEEWEPFDLQAHGETWDDMMRLQAENFYPQAFVSIKSPVLMVHGQYDPHPGAMIRDNLLNYIPHLEYRELERCGHYPWNEKAARDRIISITCDWIADKAR